MLRISTRDPSRYERKREKEVPKETWKKRDCLLLKRGKDSDEEHPARLHSPPFQSALPQPVLTVL